MNRTFITIIALAGCYAAAVRAEQPAPASRIVDLQSRVIDLTFQVTDLSGNPVAVGGKVEDFQIHETPTEIRIDLAADVLFDFDKSEILPKAADVLHKAAEVIRQHERQVVRIEGHTDGKGSDAYNQSLSERRAESVRRWFVTDEKLGGVRFETRGWGAQKPVAPNQKPDGSDDPDGRQKNRRVEIVVTKD